MTVTFKTAFRKHPPVYAEHAVKRIVDRGVPIVAVSMIVRYGVTVEKNGERLVKRGEFENVPIHVVVHKPETVISVYFADEWTSEITVHRSLKDKALPNVVGQ